YNTANGQGVNFTNSPTFSLYTDYNTGGSFVAWEKTADEVLKWDFDTVVPGHGPVAKRDLMLKWHADMDAIQKRIRSMVREGKTRALQKAVVFVIVFLGVAIPALSHHGTAASYDMSRSVTLTGVVTEYVFTNPHAQLYADVKDTSGEVLHWGCELNSPGNLRRD